MILETAFGITPILNRHSPLARPYFLYQETGAARAVTTSGDAKPRADARELDWGEVLSTRIRTALRALWPGELPKNYLLASKPTMAKMQNAAITFTC